MGTNQFVTNNAAQNIFQPRALMLFHREFPHSISAYYAYLLTHVKLNSSETKMLRKKNLQLSAYGPVHILKISPYSGNPRDFLIVIVCGMGGICDGLVFLNYLSKM